MKKWNIIIVLACLLLSLLAGCDKKEKPMDVAQAQKIALEALKVSEADVSGIHTHAVTHEGAACYSFHITVGGASREVIVDAVTGEVLHIGDASH